MKVSQLIIQTEKPKDNIAKLLSGLDYIVCTDQLQVLLQDDAGNLGKIFDAHLYLQRIFKELQPHLQIRFRVELIVHLSEDKATMDRYLKTISHFQKYGTAYGIRYFLVEAFDGESESSNKNGWWGIKDYTDLTDPQSYVEKESGKMFHLF